jgi:hypothetical protein
VYLFSYLSTGGQNIPTKLQLVFLTD